MQRLRVLNLNSNKLIDFKQMNIEFTLGIKQLNVDNNPTINFEYKRDFISLLNKLKKLNLESLNIDISTISEFDGMGEIIK